jgi:hypothetical protein
MLVAGMRFTNTPNPEQQACQFIASLADMVDRDNLETLYRAPDGTGAWGLGVEKFPVLNEIVFFSGSSANTANYDLTALRIELYNPAHNIPWIPDATEAYGIADYRLRITSNAGGSYTCRLGDLKQYGFADPNQEIGMVSMIGADGLYADPNDATQRTWSRLVHCGWTKGTSPLPAQLTRAFLEGGLVFELWKPLSGDAMATPLSTGKVETIDGMPCLCVDRAGGDAPLQLIRSYKPNDPGPSAKQTTYVGCYRRCDPLNARIYGTQGNDDSSVVWGQGSGTTGAGGWTLAHVTLGKPNVGYPQPKDLTKTSVFRYNRMCEREFKVVNGDLPSIGWLGELMMWNVATDGPLTMVHSGPQDPGWWSKSGTYHGNPKADELDCKAKFDLCRPFFPAGKYNPKGTEVNPSNIHMLDIFTVWDPSNDGIDNDGDGAIDDEDTGLQAGDKCGPEMRVFGQLDLNSAPRRVMATIMPNNFDFYMWMSYYNRYVSWTWDWISQSAYFQIMAYRQEKRGPSGTGPYETIGDLLRADSLTLSPGRLMYGGIGSWNNDPAGNMGEGGVNGYYYTDATAAFSGDDDGDGIFDERDERDMLFTWLADFITTRSQVYEIDMNVDVCEPPFYPGNKYPYPAYKSKKSYGRKQVLGILDRSTCLRINPNRTCDFSGPVEVRMLRFSDDLRVH